MSCRFYAKIAIKVNEFAIFKYVELPMELYAVMYNANVNGNISTELRLTTHPSSSLKSYPARVQLV
jgi:hypothetical protein